MSWPGKGRGNAAHIPDKLLFLSFQFPQYLSAWLAYLKWVMLRGRKE